MLEIGATMGSGSRRILPPLILRLEDNPESHGDKAGKTVLCFYRASTASPRPSCLKCFLTKDVLERCSTEEQIIVAVFWKLSLEPTSDCQSGGQRRHMHKLFKPPVRVLHILDLLEDLTSSEARNFSRTLISFIGPDLNSPIG